MSVQGRVDCQRGCGWRKAGGLYLVGDPLTTGCGRLPLPLSVCPTCHHGIHPARGWTWIDGAAIARTTECPHTHTITHHFCLLNPDNAEGKKFGLLWIGEKFYKTPLDFLSEARDLGISRRIKALPKGYEPGKTVVLLAHRKTEVGPGIFAAFIPRAVEYVVKGNETPEQIEALEKRGITPVEVVHDGDLFTAAQQTELELV